MPHFVTTYRYYDNGAERRAEVLPAHREYLDVLTGLGQLQVAGPLADGEPGGAILLVAAESEEGARALIAADPFVLEGVVAEFTLSEWRPVSGALAQQF